MKWKILEKGKIPVLIQELAKKYEVCAPVEKRSVASFERVSLGSEASLDLKNTRVPPKQIALPQTEILFSYKVHGKDLEIEAATAQNKRTVLVGIRPCDARSFVMLDKFFSSGEYKDSTYLEKRGNMITIGVACTNPLGTCFCTSTGGSPFGKEGIDVLLQDINGKYLVETVTEKGARLVEELPWLGGATEADKEKAKKRFEEAEKSIASKVPVEGLSEKLETIFEDAVWNQISEKCVGCGVCTYLCPTCCCFDVLDEEGRRVRIWDSCQFPGFTLQGSGHDPRPSRVERMRQRIMHKFSYFVKNFEDTLCVGCGRCVRECPVNLDIREIIEQLSTKQVE